MIILRNDWDFIDPQLLIYFDELLWSVLNDARLESLEAIWANRSRPRMSQHSQVAHSASVSLRYTWFLWFFPWVFRLCFHVCLLKFRPPPFFLKKIKHWLHVESFRWFLILRTEQVSSVEAGFCEKAISSYSFAIPDMQVQQYIKEMRSPARQDSTRRYELWIDLRTLS